MIVPIFPESRIFFVICVRKETRGRSVKPRICKGGGRERKDSVNITSSHRFWTSIREYFRLLILFFRSFLCVVFFPLLSISKSALVFEGERERERSRFVCSDCWFCISDVEPCLFSLGISEKGISYLCKDSHWPFCRVDHIFPCSACFSGRCSRREVTVLRTTRHCGKILCKRSHEKAWHLGTRVHLFQSYLSFIWHAFPFDLHLLTKFL